MASRSGVFSSGALAAGSSDTRYVSLVFKVEIYTQEMGYRYVQCLTPNIAVPMHLGYEARGWDESQVRALARSPIQSTQWSKAFDRGHYRQMIPPMHSSAFSLLPLRMPFFQLLNESV